VIADYQTSKIQKVAPAAPDEQAQAVAPELLRTVEISFYHHEVYVIAPRKTLYNQTQ
jgi:hypothetical protein